MASSGDVELSVALEKTGAFGRFHYRLLGTMIPASMTGVMVVNTITYIQPAVVCDLKISKYEQGLLFSAVYFGMIVGGLVWGMMADIIGRRKTLLILLSAAAFFEFCTVFTFSYWQLFVMKLCSGFMSTGIMTTAYTYVNEFIDPKERDHVTMGVGAITALGYFVQPLIAVAVLPLNVDVVIIPHFLEVNNWKLFQIVCSLFPAVGFILFYEILDESPAFLLRKQRATEALEVVKKIYVKNTKKPIETFDVTKLHIQETTTHSSEEESSFVHQVKMLFSHPYLITLIIVICCQFITMSALAGVRAHLATIITMALGIGQPKNVTHLEPLCTLFKTQKIFGKHVRCPGGKIKLVPEIYICTAIIGFFIFSSFIPMTRLLKKIGKQSAFVLLHYVAALVISIVPFVTAHAAVALLTVFALSMQNNLTIGVGLIVGRVPTAIRGLTLSIVLIGGRIGVIIGSMILPIMTDISCPVGFWSIAFLNFLALPLLILYAMQEDPLAKPKAEENKK